MIGLLALFVLFTPAMAQTDMPAQINWRYDEDWTALRDAPVEPDAPWWLPAKDVNIWASGEVYASFGLEVRARYEGFRNNFWGDPPAPDDGYLWLRAMPHIDLHAGPVRAFIQPIAATARGVKSGNGPVDATGIDMLQAFADLRFPLGDDEKFMLRAGRALMPLGSERLVGTRYGPNIPQAFDGGRIDFESGALTASLFSVDPVAIGQDNFDDQSSPTKHLDGLYTTTRLTDGVSLDAYWLGYRNVRAAFAQGVGRERRDTFGLRLFGERGGWGWNWEAIVQRGRFADMPIRAWSLATETAYQFTAPLKPRVRLRANMVSGDSDPNDRQLGTFNALFPKGKYFGELSPIGPYNIANLHPNLDLDLGRGVTFDLAAIAYWRASRGDGIYDVPGHLIRAPGDSHARFVGTQLEAVGSWQVNQALSLTASYSIFTAGQFIRETGLERCIHMVGAEAMYRF